MLSVPRVFEKVYNAAKQKAEADGKGRIFARAEQVAIAYSEALEARSARPGAARPARGLRPAGLPQAARRTRRPVPRRDLRRRPARRPAGHFFRGIGVTILEGYGLTETSPAAAANLHGTRIGTVGRPLPG